MHMHTHTHTHTHTHIQTHTLHYATSLEVGPRGSSENHGVAKGNLGPNVFISFSYTRNKKP